MKIFGTILISVMFTWWLTTCLEDVVINQKWQDDAVAHGKAEYYLDQHNERQWRWKP